MTIYLLRTLREEPLMPIRPEFGMTRYNSVSSAVDRIRKKLATNDGVMKRLGSMVAVVNKNQTET